MKTWIETTLLFILLGLATVLTVLSLTSCGHTNHKKKLLEDMNPGCEVTDELQMICPGPY